MRARNGYRGLHEFLSGTRVVRLPAAAKRWAFRADRPDQALAGPAGLPGRVGVYAIRGALRWEPEFQVLVGEDAALERQVVILLRPQSAPPLSGARRELTRPTRLRWLAGGQSDGRQWDAFLAPRGKSLPELVRDNGGLPWPEVRAILEQLTAELRAAAKDATMPACLGVDQVRVESSGQVQLLDWPLQNQDQAGGPGGSEDSPEQQALALVGQVAVLALEGRPEGPDVSRGREHPVHAPVPEHAADLLAPLLGFQKPYRRLDEWERALAATRDRPAELTRGRRAAHLAALTGLVFLAVCGCMLPAGSTPGFVALVRLSLEVQSGRHAFQELDEGTWREFAAAAVNPDPKVRLRGLAQLDADRRLGKRLKARFELLEQKREAQLKAMGWFARQMDQEIQKQIAQQAHGPLWETRGHGVATFRQRANDTISSLDSTIPDRESAAAVWYTIWLVFWPVAWVLWAFAWRGGFSFGWLGLSLARADGRKAARWQCALRALFVWAPVVGLWLASLWLDAWYWSAWPASESAAWVPWLSWGLWWQGLALLPVYALLAFCFPRRSLQDWLAGTYLVPR
jgi:hypothetical protein